MNRLLMTVAMAAVLAAPAWAGPSDLFTEKVMDFGVSPKGTVLVHYFRFTNTTKQTITLGSPRVSCGCVSAAVSTNRVAPGESAAVIAYMDTRRIPTPNVDKSVLVYVPFLAPQQEEVTLRVQTVARDDLMMSPDTLGFGNVKKGQGGEGSTKVTFLSDPNWQDHRGDEHRRLREGRGQAGVAERQPRDLRGDRDPRQGLPGGQLGLGHQPEDLERSGCEAPHPGDGERRSGLGRGQPGSRLVRQRRCSGLRRKRRSRSRAARRSRFSK